MTIGRIYRLRIESTFYVIDVKVGRRRFTRLMGPDLGQQDWRDLRDRGGPQRLAALWS
jgi:hypothetical protein